MALKLRVDEKPKNFGEWLLLSLQHIFASFSGIVTVPLIFGGSLGFDKLATGEMIAGVLVVSGIVTVIQSYGVGMFGSRLPQMMGSNFTFIGPGCAIGAAVLASGGTSADGYAAILGASMAGSFVQIILGNFAAKVQKFFPPIIQGIVVTLIGLTILPVAVAWLGGGFGNPEFGALKYVSLGLIVMMITIFLNQFGKGIFSSGSILFGMIAGYLIAIPMGILDAGSVVQKISEANLINIPKPFKYGMPTFKLEYIVPFAIAYLVAMAEATGDTLACAKVAEVDMEAPENSGRLRGAIVWGGLGSFIGSLFNATPTTTFSQNTGVVSITGVASRWVVIGSGILLVIMGLMPKIGVLVAVMPDPVLGGAGLVMFGTIAAVGISIFKEIEFTNSNLLIIGLSLGMGLAVTFNPAILGGFPESLKTIFSSGITTGTVTAIILNLCFGSREEAVEKKAVLEQN